MMQASIKTHRATSTPIVHRIGARTFWTLLALEGLLLTIVLAWAISTLPARTSVQETNNLPRLQAAIMDRISGAVADPLIEVRPGVSIRSSNVRGLTLNGVTYFYYLEGQPNFDPYSRGAVPAERVETLLRDTSGPAPLVIYTIHE